MLRAQWLNRRTGHIYIWTQNRVYWITVAVGVVVAVADISATANKHLHQCWFVGRFLNNTDNKKKKQKTRFQFNFGFDSSHNLLMPITARISFLKYRAPIDDGQTKQQRTNIKPELSVKTLSAQYAKIPMRDMSNTHEHRDESRRKNKNIESSWCSGFIFI